MTKFTTFSLTHIVNSPPDLGIVECIATPDCSGEGLGNMTSFNCCIEEEEGFAFRIPDSDTCHVCIGMYGMIKYYLHQEYSCLHVLYVTIHNILMEHPKYLVGSMMSLWEKRASQAMQCGWAISKELRQPE